MLNCFLLATEKEDSSHTESVELLPVLRPASTATWASTPSPPAAKRPRTLRFDFFHFCFYLSAITYVKVLLHVCVTNFLIILEFVIVFIIPTDTIKTDETLKTMAKLRK